MAANNAILRVMYYFIKTLIAILSFCLLVACASQDKTAGLNEQELYEAAQTAINKNDFESAVEYLQALEARYPFGPYADQAQLEIIYAYYRNNEPEAAIAAADRFINLHPQHPSVDYAYYMKGLANYTDNQGAIDRFLPTDITQRDPGAALQSFDDFRQLLYRFPNSPYAADAQARMLYLRARLARFEINVANYYFAREAYIAALNRGQYVVQNYPQTPAVGDALAVMTQAYLLLGLDELADDSVATLRTNFPDHPSLDSNGQFISQLTLDQQQRSWLDRISFGLLDRPSPPKFDNRAPYLVP